MTALRDFLVLYGAFWATVTLFGVLLLAGAMFEDWKARRRAKKANQMLIREYVERVIRESSVGT